MKLTIGIGWFVLAPLVAGLCISKQAAGFTFLGMLAFFIAIPVLIVILKGK